jgi:hypothetical protein
VGGDGGGCSGGKFPSPFAISDCFCFLAALAARLDAFDIASPLKGRLPQAGMQSFRLFIIISGDPHPDPLPASGERERTMRGVRDYLIAGSHIKVAFAFGCALIRKRKLNR